MAQDKKFTKVENLTVWISDFQGGSKGGDFRVSNTGVFVNAGCSGKNIKDPQDKAYMNFSLFIPNAVKAPKITHGDAVRVSGGLSFESYKRKISGKIYVDSIELSDFTGKKSKKAEETEEEAPF
jgi:hypothetical protein